MNKKLVVFMLMLSLGYFVSCANPKEENKSQVMESSDTDTSGDEGVKTEIVQETDNNEDSTTDESESASEKADASSGSDAEESEPMTIEQIAKADEIIAEVTMANVDAVDAKKLFRMHCAICHGFKGDMKINGAKDLTKSDIPLNQSVAQIYHGKGLMTPYKGILSDAEIVALAKYSATLSK